MIGKRYWSTGISLGYSGDQAPAWSAALSFQDDGFASDDPATGQISTEGELRTRYYVPTGGIHQRALRLVTDTLIHTPAHSGSSSAIPTSMPTRTVRIRLTPCRLAGSS